MKKYFLFLTCIFFVAGHNLYSQSLRDLHGYEWIKPGQKYIKTKIAETGVYRITVNDLVASGLDIVNAKGNYVQVWNLGKQIPVYVSNDELLGSQDYIEFVGEKLTIGLDSLLFVDWRNEMLNTEYGFVTDSNTYFITVDSSTISLRYQTVSPDYNQNQSPILSHYIHEEKKVYTDIFYKLQHGDLQYSNFEPAEGWAKQGSKESTIEFKLDDYVNVGIPAKIGARLSSTIFYTQLIPRINNELKDTITFNAGKTIHTEYSIPPEKIENTMSLQFKNNFFDDLHRLAFAYIQYPRDLKFNNSNHFQFSFGKTEGNFLVPITDFVHNEVPPIVYNPVTGQRILTKLKGANTFDVLLNITPKDIYFVSNQKEGFKSTSKLEIFEPVLFEKSEKNYLIVSHKNLTEGANAYATYRESLEGGSHNVAIIEMDDIYNHFGYGIDRHFYAIKNLTKFLKTNWDSLKHVFLLGKGLGYSIMRSPYDVEKHDGIRSFIPGYGMPPSDNMLFSDDNLANPHFAIGRYAALNSQEIFNYLDKVKLYEKAYENPQTIASKYWMKKVLHLSGGGAPAEHTLIRNNLSNMESRLENSLMGAEVYTFFKTSTDQLASASLEGITNLINDGVNIITFFGHSAPGTWDFNLEDPSKYTNFGKYPFINSLGCYSGNIFGEKSETISERFVKSKDKGAIGFVASGGTASITLLGQFGYEKYGHIGYENFGNSIGTILKIMANKYKDVGYQPYAFYQQLILHCDPAIKIYHFEGPDYTFDYASVRTTPDLINSSIDTISLEFDLYNLGKGIQDSVDVEFYHILPNNEVFDTVRVILPAPLSRQTYTIKLKNAGVKGIGKNVLLAKIDPNNLKLEVPGFEGKANNELVSESGPGFTFYILDNTALPIEPCNYAIINNVDVTLKASTSNALIQRGNYVFQIDTTRLFNSPVFSQQKIENVQGLIQWEPEMPYSPGIVYYWRVSPDSISSETGFVWQNSSFIYLPESEPGFNNSHYFQFTDNNQPGKINIYEDRKFKFPFGEYFLDITNGVFTNFIPGIIGYKFNFEKPSATVRPWSFMPNGGVCIVIGNPITGAAIENKGGEYGSINTNFPPNLSYLDPSFRCFGFPTTTTEERKKIIDFLESTITEGHYAFFFTVMMNNNTDLKVEDWENDIIEHGTSIPELLREQGALLIDSLTAKESLPYTFIYRKGMGAINEGLLEDKSEFMSTKFFLPFENIDGTISIQHIGPASSWDRLEYTLSNVESSDTMYLNIFGTKDNKTQDTLVLGEKLFNINLNQIDASKYPYLNVELYFKDAVQRTVPNINFFRVFFTPVLDLALDPKTNYSFLATKLNRGETMVASVSLANLSKENVDSIQVKYSVINLEDNSEYTEIKKAGPIPGNQNILLDFNHKMLGKPGRHVFVVEANHDKIIMEKHHFNNIGKQEFEVVKDKFNPFLDVYFDGQKILDGDIVSTNPEIKFLLKDENSFLTLDNVELFTIKLDTGRNQIKEIPLDGPDIIFEASNETNKAATLKYYPEFKTGEYKLIVQAKDASGNFAGVNERVISFRVIEEETVTQVLNYPNPFSTSTQFIFTLTGTIVPEDFSIRIYTITGKLIREINQNELGPLRIGTNRTHFKWDGTDEYGQKLANGVYLYKAFVNNNQGESYKTNTHNRVDQAFNEGFGKMVILR